jgi:antitoxin HigA-1
MSNTTKVYEVAKGKRLHNPPHPGKVIAEMCLKENNLSVTDAADALGVARKTLSELLNGHSSLSIEMAIRLSKVFGGETATWLGVQMDYDVSRANEIAHTVVVHRSFRETEAA